MPHPLVSTPISELVELDLAALWSMLETVENWRDLHAETLDSVYRHHLVQTIRRQSDTATLAALSEHLGDVLHADWAPPLNQLNKPYLDRWQGYRDILERRLAARFKPLPEAFTQDPIVKTLLERAESEPLTRARLPDNMGEETTQHLLMRMEQAELIVVLKDHPGERIQLGARAYDMLDAPDDMISGCALLKTS